MATESDDNPANPPQRLLSGEVVEGLPATQIAAAVSPSKQLHELPKDELDHLAEDYGLDPRESKSRQHLVAAIHDRRQLIAALDRPAMLDVIRWGRRPVTENATNEQLAQEIFRIKSMQFAGLSQRGLMTLAQLRGIACNAQEDVPHLIRKLKKQEGFFTRMNRKRRAVLGSMVSNMLGESESTGEYQFLPPSESDPQAPPPTPSIKQEIEESGLFGGITSRLKRSADEYLNQKLDEIEARIDRKLDEIDRRLGEWRDKEIANRIRILKITLWASVIVGAFSLVYSYMKEAFFSPDVPAQVQPAQKNPPPK
jgi:hypothetical protein